MKCGLLGRKLGHSYSPAIHSHFGNYEYALFEKEPEELEDFLRHGDFDGLNVTMPYKKAIIPYLDELTPIAAQLGAVNTIVRRAGKLIGHNTDYFGFHAMVEKSGLSPAGKKCLVLGSGGASKVVSAVLAEYGAEVIVISRNGKDNYENFQKHDDTRILVNATPVGMYPGNGESLVDLTVFPRLEGVLDLIYNPARTQLLMAAEHRSIVAMNGLWMLIAQAKEAAQWFTGTTLPNHLISPVHTILRSQMENIILIGMPGCGKTTVGKLMAAQTDRTFVDCDAEVEQLAKKSIPEIFAQDGESVFRDLESRVLAHFGKESGLVISTGGGCVTQVRNYPLLHQNGTIYYLKREASKLPSDGRPLSQTQNLKEMQQKRAPLYARFADFIIDNNSTAEDAVKALLEEIQ